MSKSIGCAQKVFHFQIQRSKNDHEKGGDYHGINEDYVGLWFWNLISFEKRKPLEYKEFDIKFKEY